MPGLVVLGGDDRIEGVTQKVYFKGMDGTHLMVDKLDDIWQVGEGDEIKVGGLNIRCLFTPCHTSGHICYYVTQVITRSSLLYLEQQPSGWFMEAHPCIIASEVQMQWTNRFWTRCIPDCVRMRIRLSSPGTPCSLVAVADSSKEQWVLGVGRLS